MHHSFLLSGHARLFILKMQKERRFDGFMKPTNRRSRYPSYFIYRFTIDTFIQKIFLGLKHEKWFLLYFSKNHFVYKKFIIRVIKNGQIIIRKLRKSAQNSVC